ncbi:MAG: hypothetical protein ABSB59_43030 [Streptosporangiaceae bacterium]
MPAANQYVVFGVLKSNEVLLPAGTVTAPSGADVYGLVGRPVSHQVTGGEVGALVEPTGAELVGSDEGADAGVEVGAVGLVDGEVAGDVAVALPEAGEVGVEVAAGVGAVSRATVAASGTDEGTRPQFAPAAVPVCPARVAAATWACAESFTVAWSFEPDGAVATAAWPDEPRP